MDILLVIIQIIIALGIFNVWVLRYRKQTPWRGGTAKNMKEEFLVYGLPVWFMIAIGIIKVTLAILLVVGIWIPIVVKPAATILAVLMLGAISMHIKVKDSFKKSLPAIIMFVLSVLIVFLIKYV